jgi:hypothetical protein
MPLYVFEHESTRIASVTINARSTFEHRFGGSATLRGYCFDTPEPLHLIYTLDQNDPLCPTYLKGYRFLPLFYPLRYSGGCTYRIDGDKITIVGPRYLTAKYQPWEAPPEFIEASAAFQPYAYDATSAEDVMAWKAVFGWDSLDADRKQQALQIAKRTSDIDPSTHAPEDTWTYEQTVDACYTSPFVQGPPSSHCQNKSCGSWDARVIALQDEPVDRELIWPDKFTQTFWTFCPHCHCIEAESYCT